MEVTLVSYDGNAINTGDYTAKMVDPAAWAQARARAIVVDRPGGVPSLARTKQAGKTFNIKIIMTGTYDDNITELTGWFDIADDTPKKLLFADPDTTQWYMMCVPLRQINSRKIPSEVTFEMYAEDPVFFAETETTDTWSIVQNDSPDTNDVVVAGNVKSLPKITIKPTGARGSLGFGYRRFCKAVNPSSYRLRKWPVNLANSEAANGLDTDALTTAKMLANGNDLEIHVNGHKVNRWLNDMDSTSTEIWVNLNFKPGLTLSLSGAMTDVATPTEVTIIDTSPNAEAYNDLPQSGQFLIDSEYFTYTGKGDDTDPDRFVLTGVTRAAFDSTAAAHTDEDTITWIEHQIWMYYGRPVVDGRAAPDPNTSNADARKPMILLSSENNRWEWDNLATRAGTRSAEWEPSDAITIAQYGGGPNGEIGTVTGTYSAAAGTYADPASVAGMLIAGRLVGTSYRTGRGDISWYLDMPLGVTAVETTGEKARSGDDWPAKAELLSSVDGENWVQEWNEATPSGSGWAIDNSLTANGLGAQALAATHYKLAYRFKGGVSGTADTASQATAHFEVSNVDIDLASEIAVAISAETATYDFDMALKNNTTGDIIKIEGPILINETLVIDTDARTVYVEDDNSNKIGYLRLVGGVRDDWLPLQGATTNELQMTDTGTGALTIKTIFRSRNN